MGYNSDGYDYLYEKDNYDEPDFYDDYDTDECGIYSSDDM